VPETAAAANSGPPVLPPAGAALQLSCNRDRYTRFDNPRTVGCYQCALCLLADDEPGGSGWTAAQTLVPDGVPHMAFVAEHNPQAFPVPITPSDMVVNQDFADMLMINEEAPLRFHGDQALVAMLLQFKFPGRAYTVSLTRNADWHASRRRVAQEAYDRGALLADGRPFSMAMYDVWDEQRRTQFTQFVDQSTAPPPSDDHDDGADANP
jgi:hypothetical protein